MFFFFYLKCFCIIINEKFTAFILNITKNNKHIKRRSPSVFAKRTCNIIIILVIFILIIFMPALILQGCGLFYFDEENLSLPDTVAESNKYSKNPDSGGSTGSIDYVSENGEVYKNSNDGDDVQPDTFLVYEVIDGDTFIIKNGESVRLLGINAPEMDRYYYEESGEVLRIIVEDKKVRLEKDITNRDLYGRFLRYVYLDDLFVNLEMVKRGFANVFTMAPDVKYADILVMAERYARENELGLWQKSLTSGIKVTVNYDAEGDDRKNLNGEYVILENSNSYDIDIGGWSIKDSATNIYDFGNFIFKSNSRIFLYTGSGKDSIEEGKFYWGSTKPVWNNDHDTLYLRDREGLLVEIYNY
ncbi:MAG: hypothetical protein FJW61_01245 [Actinobacteria bacterium]|nr:hypothetical protein [Actinomycetota bacterium]